MKGQPKAVIFDMDGVLIDARDWHFRALNEALAIFDASIDVNEHIEKFNGLPTKIKLEMLSKDNRIPGHIHQLIETVKQERTLREAASLCFPRVEHLLLFGWLKQQECKIGVATNSIRSTSTTMLEFAGLLKHLDVLVTNEDVNKAKPDPEIYLSACRQLKVSPLEVLVVEDHTYGVAAAKAAGCTVLKVDGVEQVCTALLEPYFVGWGA